MKTYLGIEFGSTRIKAVQIDEAYRPVSSGGYIWRSRCEGGVWTYDISEALRGLRTALEGVVYPEDIECVGVSGMMHGYLAFDRNWNLLVPFRTWQNTMTATAAEELTRLFGFNIPQRWSIAHLYQAVLNGEPHVKDIAHITTLAGYIHFLLTGENVLGAGEASGMFPIDGKTLGYDAGMIEKFDALVADKGFPWHISDILPRVLPAGEYAGRLTPAGAELTGGVLHVGVPFAPPEGDAGTGMTATNSVLPRRGNVSAGTSIFSMVVLEHLPSKTHPEIDVVTTPDGAPVAMVHCNNCTADMNAWVSLLCDAAELQGAVADREGIYRRLYLKSLEGAPDCGGITVYNYLSGEGVTALDEGRPIVVRRPDAEFTLANFIRAQLYTALATLKIGMDILSDEGVVIDVLTGHGGLFKTPGVGQRYLAAAAGAPVSCMETAGEGGPYGMALLASFTAKKAKGQTLGEYLEKQVFAGAKVTTLSPDPVDAAGFERYMERFRAGLETERTAVRYL
ncbi:MAG: FGGY-family carbohydrate kinase [Eubacteriales bacterium]|nr:FGGY-family carbohydrate kinase [Eubacteriales bacterium]